VARRVGELEGTRPGRSLALVFEQGGEAAPFSQGQMERLDVANQPTGAAPAKEPLGPLPIALEGAGLASSTGTRTCFQWRCQGC